MCVCVCARARVRERERERGRERAHGSTVLPPFLSEAMDAQCCVRHAPAYHKSKVFVYSTSKLFASACRCIAVQTEGGEYTEALLYGLPVPVSGACVCGQIA